MALKYSRLTTSALSKLEPGCRITERGIEAIGLQNGDVRFSINVMVDRQRIHRVVGCASQGVTRETAARTLESLRTRAREARLDLPFGRKTCRTLADVAPQYIELLGLKGGKNIKIKSRHLNRNLIPILGSKPLSAIGEAEIEAYRRARLKQGVVDGTVNRELATLSHLFTAAVKAGWVLRRPKIKLVKEEAKDFATLTESEIADLIGAAAQEPDDLMTRYLWFALNTPMRPAEILAARFEHVNRRVPRLMIPVAKAGARLQPITKSLHTFLIQLAENRGVKSGWIFPSPVKRGRHRVSINVRFRKTVAAARLDPLEITPYTCKRTTITQLIEAGVDLPTAQKITGHKTMIMLLRYFQARGKHVDQAVAHLERPIAQVQLGEAF